MQDDIEVQFRRQAELDEAIEAEIARVLQRRRWVVSGAVLLLLGVVGYSGWWLLHGGPAPRVDAYLESADRHLREHALGAALTDLKRVIQADPQQVRARWMLARVHLWMGDGEAAEQAILAVPAGGGVKASDRVTIRLRALLLERRYADVLVEAARATQQDARALTLQCEAQLGLKRLERAVQACDAALDVDPENMRAGLARARVALSLSDVEGAEQRVAEALVRDKADPEALLLQGVIALSRGAMAEAGAAFDAALVVAPAHPEAHLGLGQVYLMHHDPEQARQHLAKAHTASQRRPAAVAYLDAVAALQSEEVHRARNALRDLLKTSPDHVDSLYLLATINHAQKQYRQAENSLTHLLGIAPGHAGGRKLLATVYLDLGQPGDAIEALLDASREAPQDAQALALLARAYRDAGDAQAADRALEKLSALGTTDTPPFDPTPLANASVTLAHCAVLVHFCEQCFFRRECL